MAFGFQIFSAGVYLWLHCSHPYPAETKNMKLRLVAFQHFFFDSQGEER